uniref:clp protease proteolytic subunit n=1 Tax=Medicago soleirolii TaxID=78530 RepID=UPI00226D32EF|nr:clp protease proteolytic subunit [Medicago soleirolii]UZC32215.1 clp protease proteolytic subunit [Medicago soleirolii]UZC32291.1 clp protease proteolytic subunit [Medicago soleirolii]
MPVGVPKVPFQLPEEDEASWVDLYNVLYRKRLLFLGQEIESEVSNQLVGLMVFLSLEDKTRDLYLLINSPGGEVMSGMAIFDAMQFVQPDVHTLGIGLAASMGSLLLVGGEFTKRIAFPNARVMIHQPSISFFEGSATDCAVEADELLNLRNLMTDIYAQRTGKAFWKIYVDMERDFFMSAEEAQDHGIVDLVADQNNPNLNSESEGGIV